LGLERGVPGGSIQREAPKSVADHVRSDGRSGWKFVARWANRFCGVRMEGLELGGGIGGWFDEVGGRERSHGFAVKSFTGQSFRACEAGLIRVVVAALFRALRKTIPECTCEPAGKPVVGESFGSIGVDLSSAWRWAKSAFG
jgi:hypothetical protein